MTWQFCLCMFGPQCSTEVEPGTWHGMRCLGPQLQRQGLRVMVMLCCAVLLPCCSARTRPSRTTTLPPLHAHNNLTLWDSTSKCSGSWKDETFKEYNFNALGLMPAGGHLHPLLKASVGRLGRQAK